MLFFTSKYNICACYLHVSGSVFDALSEYMHENEECQKKARGYTAIRYPKKIKY